ncbi:MAG: glutaredoxin family protein [Nocardioidaceae bacterium]|nr:glutaredoxin family protein [Nocardioidaceae bacterium]
MTARVHVLTRRDCHLCEVALGVVAQVCDELGESWTEQDVDSDPDLVRTYGDEVPVTFVDGERHDFWRVDAGRLRAALA